MAEGEAYRVSVDIDAPPEEVFPYFTDPAALVAWMGDFAVIDGRPGGEFSVDINGVPVRGRFLAVDPPRHIRIAWGHAGSDRLPPGSSTVDVTLTAVAGGTRVDVIHAGLPEPERGAHAAGWPHFLDRLRLAAAGGDPGPDPWAGRPDASGGTGRLPGRPRT